MSDRYYRAVPHESFRLGFNKHLVCIAGTDRQLCLPGIDFAVFSSCSRCDTLGGLAHRASEALQSYEISSMRVKDAIARLLEIGLILPLDQLLQTSAQSSSAIPKITSVGFITARRPYELKRALESYANNFATYGREVELVVMDDSKSDQDRAACLQTLRSCKCDLPIRYAGFQEKQIYIGELVRLGIDPEVARFAILGEFEGVSNTTGANRNSLLLDTVGQFIFSADDDTICELFPHPERHDNLQFKCRGNPREMWYYGDHERLRNEAKSGKYDLLSEHERLLGRSLAQIVSEIPAADPKHEELCSHALHFLGRLEGAVRVTMNGVIGESGAQTGRWLLASSGQTRARLTQDESTFKKALDSHHVFGVVPSFTVAHPSFCAGASLGLANNGILPPFLPVGRSQDSAFGALLGLMDRSVFIGHIPVAVLHTSEEKRYYQPIPDFRVWELVISLASLVAHPYKRDSRSVLKAIGEAFLNVASLPDQNFWTVVMKAASTFKAGTLLHLESALTGFVDGPDYWTREVVRYHRECARCLEDPNYYIPSEICNAFPTLDLAREKTKKLVRQTGHFFRAWPDIVDAAGELIDNEIRSSRGFAILQNK